VTAAAFAELVQAEPTGGGRWKAHCPAHHDRSPSLSIREGDDGRVLVLCRAGCALDSILVALKLGKRDLFAGPPPSPEQLAAMQAARDAHQQEARAERKARLEAINRADKLQAVVNSLGAKLARSPDDEDLNQLFVATLERHRVAETDVDNFYPVRRDSAQDKVDTDGQSE